MIFSPKEKGQALIEYALILMMIAVVAIVYTLILQILWDSFRQMIQVIIDHVVMIH